MQDANWYRVCLQLHKGKMCRKKEQRELCPYINSHPGWQWNSVSPVSSVQFSSVAQSCLTLWPCGLQHARPPCPSPTPRAYSNSCPLSWWCHPTASFSVTPFSSAFSLSQHQGLLQWVSSSHQVAKVLELQLQHQSFKRIFRTDLLWDGLVGSPCSPRDSQSLLQHHSSKASILQHLTFYMVRLSHPYMTTGKTIALTRWTSVSKVMSLFLSYISIISI